MDNDTYIKFNAPMVDFDGNWVVRSSEKDACGKVHFIAFDAPSRPYVVTTDRTGFVLSCNSEQHAHEELAFYYSFHGDDYPYQAQLNELLGRVPVSVNIESQVMVFE